MPWKNVLIVWKWPVTLMECHPAQLWCAVPVACTQSCLFMCWLKLFIVDCMEASPSFCYYKGSAGILEQEGVANLLELRLFPTGVVTRRPQQLDAPGTTQFLPLQAATVASAHLHVQMSCTDCSTDWSSWISKLAASSLKHKAKIILSVLLCRLLCRLSLLLWTYSPHNWCVSNVSLHNFDFFHRIYRINLTSVWH